MRSKIICGLALIGLLAAGCSESDDGHYVDPISLYEKLDGEWGLMNLKMVDEAAKAGAIEPSEQNLSTMFNYDTFTIRFNVDEKMKPTTYEVLGDVPPLFAPSGYWRLSSDFQQTNSQTTKIYLYSDAGKTVKTDELRLNSVPGSNGEMELQLVRSSGGTPYVSYIFKLNALNQ